MIFLVFSAIVATVLVRIQAVSDFDLVQEQWTTFKLTHSKHYRSETEEKFRMKIYIHNTHKINAHNQKYQLGLVKYDLCMNQYGDMLRHELDQLLNGYNRSSTPLQNDKGSSEGYGYDGITFIPPENVELPQSVDWREKGAVTPVKDQGRCGSCWSFSATGALEGQHFRKTGTLVSLSEQNLIDCSRKYHNHGCGGGYVSEAFKYIRDNHGIDTEKSYPYEGKNDRCRYNPKNSGAADRGYNKIKSRSEKDLQAAVATVGPISVAIDASHHSFHFYCKGVYDEPKCHSKHGLDHAVLVVGYGTANDGHDYWLVKNSWSSTWGNKGYILMSRNKNNQCGIATDANYPLV